MSDGVRPADLLVEKPLGHPALVDERDHPRVLPVTLAVVPSAASSAVDHAFSMSSAGHGDSGAP